MSLASKGKKKKREVRGKKQKKQSFECHVSTQFCRFLSVFQAQEKHFWAKETGIRAWNRPFRAKGVKNRRFEGGNTGLAQVWMFFSSLCRSLRQETINFSLPGPGKAFLSKRNRNPSLNQPLPRSKKGKGVKNHRFFSKKHHLPDLFWCVSSPPDALPRRETLYFSLPGSGKSFLNERNRNPSLNQPFEMPKNSKNEPFSGKKPSFLA